MHYHQNHCWCQQSNWTDDIFYARHMVSVNQWPNYDVKIAHDKQIISDDWKNIIEEKMMVSPTEYTRLKQTYAKMNYSATEEELCLFSERVCPTPRAEVISWLNENVMPSADKDMQDQPQGWCIGNNEYRMRGEVGDLTFWFLRRNDAMKFIKKWSIFKKPTTFCNYFKDEYKTLINGKLVTNERENEV